MTKVEEPWISDQVRGEEPLAPDGNSHRSHEHCIHDELSERWLCKKKPSEDSQEAPSETTGSVRKPSRKE